MPLAAVRGVGLPMVRPDQRAGRFCVSVVGTQRAAACGPAGPHLTNGCSFGSLVVLHTLDMSPRAGVSEGTFCLLCGDRKEWGPSGRRLRVC